jgi:DNA-binding transcriptional MerR regulator
MLTIQAAANAAGVKISTLRFYERQGLVEAGRRSSAGYRQYSLTEVRQLRFIRRAQELGFALEEIRRFLQLSALGPPQDEEAVRLGMAKLEDLSQRIADLSRMREALRSLMEGTHDQKLGCPVLSALADLQG